MLILVIDILNIFCQINMTGECRRVSRIADKSA